MISNRFFLICLFFTFFPSLLFAQRYNIKTYSVNKGLPQSQVHDIAQTQDGYIWMATYGGGVTKFNGTNFVTYTTEHGLKDNLVEELFVDSDDNLWIATDNGGAARFQGDSLIYPVKDDSLNNYSVASMVEFSGSMWFGTYRGGAFKYDGQELSRITKSDGLPSNVIWNFMEAEDGKLWLATGNGVSIFDGKSFVNYSVGDGLTGKQVYKIIETNDGKIWIATNNGLSIWDGNKFETIKVIDGNRLSNIFDIIEASDGRLWIATRSQGLYIFDDGEFNHLTEENGLSSNYTYNLFEDQSNQIWIATDEDGVNLYNQNGFLFYNRNNGLSNNEVLSVYQDSDDILWIGTKEGLESFDGERFQSYSLPQNYHNDYIWGIDGLPNGNKLITMPDSTLMEFDGQTFKDFSSNYGLGKSFIFDVLIDTDNDLWIGTASGLYRVDLSSGEIDHLTEEDGLANKIVFDIFEDRQGRKWIGTYYGLSVYAGGKFKTFRIEDGLVHNQVNYITQDKRGDIWVGTRGGVSVLKSVENNVQVKIDNFGKKDGMLLLNTHFLWLDDQGYLWQGTNGGLQKLNVESYRQTGNMPITHYPLSNEGMGLEFNFHAVTPQDKQRTWMGSMGWLVRLVPEEMERRSSLAELNITDIKVNSSPVNWSDYSDDLQYHNGLLDFPTVDFPSDKNIFEFFFEGISFSNPDNITYRFKLKGFTNEWMPVTKDHSAVFTNLDPGNYTFIVQARNSEMDWGNNQASFNFSIDAPFWQTYWFYGTVILFLGGLMHGLVRFRIQRQEKEELQKRVDQQTEHLIKALEEKEVLIKEIHHRVKNNLAVISGLLELQMDHADDKFVNRVLSESQRRVQSISMIHEKLYQNEKLAEIDFEKYVRELIDIIAYSFSNPEKDIRVNINIDDFKLGVDQGIPCGLILNEIVSNAFEHAFTDRTSGSIDIAVSLIDDHKIRLTVEDNGKGLSEGYEEFGHQSLGITLVETLGQQLEGDISWNSNERGTMFVLEFEKETTSIAIPT